MKKSGLWFMISIVVAMMAMFSTPAFAECYSEGIRVGSVQKFSQRGFVNKSWEGELVMEGTKFKGSNGSVRGGNVWAFSVMDASVAKVIEEAVMTGGEVALKYCQANPLDVTRGLTMSTPYKVVFASLRKQ